MLLLLSVPGGDVRWWRRRDNNDPLHGCIQRATPDALRSLLIHVQLANNRGLWLVSPSFITLALKWSLRHGLEILISVSVNFIPQTGLL